MNKTTKIGKWLFVIPFTFFGFLHFGPLEFSLPYVPTWLPVPTFWVYFIGFCLFAFSISAALGKLDKLASNLLTILLLIFVFTIHIPKAISGDFTGIIGACRDICMAGASMIYGSMIAKDSRFVN